jgi:hypothetical protein
MQFAIALFSPSEEGHVTDSVGRHMFASDAVATGTTTLSRDGVVVGSTDTPGVGTFEVPAPPATYTLRATATRSAPWSLLGTRVDATWTFRSEHIASAGLPVMVVRASGPVDDEGVARGGGPYPLTLRVQRVFDAPASEITDLKLAVSYDDGDTWQDTPVERTGEGGTALLDHPAGEGFVSLRLAARDAEGNTVEHTMIRAYQIRSDGPAPDAGSADGGGPAPGQDGGCSCRIGAGARDPVGRGSTALLLALAASVWRRRQNRRRAAAPPSTGRVSA